MPLATAASAASAGAMYVVWKAPATDSGMMRALAGGAAANFSSPLDRPGRDDLAGAVAVGGVDAGGFDRGQHLVLDAAENRGHAGRFERAGGGHFATAYGRRG